MNQQEHERCTNFGEYRGLFELTSNDVQADLKWSVMKKQKRRVTHTQTMRMIICLYIQLPITISKGRHTL